MYRIYTLYIQEEAYMQYKQIDCKIKEIYFNARPLKEEAEVIEARFVFWNSLNNLAINNMAIQQIRMA